MWMLLTVLMLNPSVAERKKQKMHASARRRAVMVTTAIEQDDNGNLFCRACHRHDVCLDACGQSEEATSSTKKYIHDDVQCVFLMRRYLLFHIFSNFARRESSIQ